MAVRYDIALVNNDLYISDQGDFMGYESDSQHIIDTMNAFPGWWKEFPIDGVGLMSYMFSGATAQEINRKIKIQLQSDGYELSNSYVLLKNGQLTINPNVNVII